MKYSITRNVGRRRDWHNILSDSQRRMTDREADACARLATVLLCGEQSAIQIFASEIERNRQRGAERAVADLLDIELDERAHERALSGFCEILPIPSDQHFLKRRAQRFFASLGRTATLAEHFVRISQLDTAVCKIMQHVENARSENVQVLRRIAHRIKVDEARHVTVSRRYASHLGYDRVLQADEYAAFKMALVEMLEPLRSSFEDIGVDSDCLFRHIAKS